MPLVRRLGRGRFCPVTSAWPMLGTGVVRRLIKALDPHSALKFQVILHVKLPKMHELQADCPPFFHSHDTFTAPLSFLLSVTVTLSGSTCGAGRQTVLRRHMELADRG